MSSNGPRLSKPVRSAFVCVAITALTLSILGLLAQTRFAQIVHLKTLDLHFLFRGTRATPNVVLVVIDQKSYDAIPDVQLFWHPYYAEVIRAAAAGGAKVLGLDIAFAVPVAKWQPGFDETLAAAVAETAPVMPVVCGYAPSFTGRQKDWPVPVNILASALGLSAFVNLTIDPDDFVREQELFATEQEGGETVLRRSLALRVAEKFTGSDAVYGQGSLTLNGVRVPMEERRMRINYAGPPGTFPRISFSDFLAAARAGDRRKIENWVKGAAVLVGVDAVSDRHPTPFFTRFQGERWSSAGVEIHANTVHTLLTHEFLPDLPRPVQIGMVASAALIASALLVFLPFSRAAIYLLAVMIVTGFISQTAFNHDVLFPSGAIQLSSLICVPFALSYRFLTAEKRGNLFHQAVRVFVGKQVAASLESAQKITLSGRREVVTVLFSDIRGFTAFCETKDPAVIVELLNNYFAVMVRIILQHGGHVNKFIGDGILAIFSESDTVPGKHSDRAVRCGAAMVQAKTAFQTGAGIHTGPVVLGNIGSSEKIEYTALGNTVNLASRIESLNKELKQCLLFSENTREDMEDPSAAVLVSSVQVRGRTLPLNVYTVPLSAPAVTADETPRMENV